MRILFVIAAVFGLVGCGTMDVAGVGGQVTTAQQNVLDARKAEDRQESKDLGVVVAAIESVAANGDNTVKVVSLMMPDRIVGGMNQIRIAKAQAPVPDGPIVAAFKAAAPYVIPGLQIWASDRAGGRALKESFGNMNLIGTIAKDIKRDPLVVNTPPQSVVLVDKPFVVDHPAPIVIEKQIPFVVDQPFVVTVPGT